jgi:transmembrane sensor
MKPPQPPSGRPPTGDAVDPQVDAALARLVHLHSGNETEDDWANYEEWKALSPRNRNAAERAEALWESLGPALVRRRIKPKPLAIILFLVGGLIAALIGSGLYGPPAHLFADQRTAFGERRSITLVDGSNVDIDANTAFDIRITAASRQLILRTGQIFVRVAPDASRPFVVRVGAGEARALGTAFGVDRVDNKTRVVVAEHAVRVSYEGQGGFVDVQQGQQVVFAPSTGLGRPHAADLRQLTAWRQGQMVFQNRPLGDVVREMSRYRWGTVIFADASLKTLPVTGVFDTDDTDGLLDVIGTVLPLKIQRLPGVTLIRSDETPRR